MAQAPPLGFLPYGSENMRVDPNGDQLSGRGPQRGASHAAHRSELRGGRLRDIGEVG